MRKNFFCQKIPNWRGIFWRGIFWMIPANVSTSYENFVCVFCYLKIRNIGFVQNFDIVFHKWKKKKKKRKFWIKIGEINFCLILGIGITTKMSFSENFNNNKKLWNLLKILDFPMFSNFFSVREATNSRISIPRLWI